MSTQNGEGTASELILYRTEDARTRIEVRLEGGTVWLTQAQMADLYQVTVKTVSEHLQNILAEGELESERTIRKLWIVQIEGQREVWTTGARTWTGSWHSMIARYWMAPVRSVMPP